MPASQAWQVEGSLAEVALLKVPSRQSTHEAAGVAPEYLPGSHSKHELKEGAEYCPELQGRQEEAPAAL